MIADAFGVASILVCIAPLVRRAPTHRIAQFGADFVADSKRGLMVWPALLGLTAKPAPRRIASGAGAYYARTDRQSHGPFQIMRK